MHARHIDFNGIPCIRLHKDDATALIALHGAHVLSWIPADGRERLFLSERAIFDGNAAIRGGVPVIFPQFGERGALAKHGFARTLPWRFTGIDAERASFELHSDARTAHWPHDFAVRLHVALSATRLALHLEVENTGTHAFTFSAALHTYLRVDALAQAAVRGLQGLDYEDSTNGVTLQRETGTEVVFRGETDRVYKNVAAPLLLVDGGRELTIEQAVFGDAVVWNPGADLAARIGDLAPDDWRHFVCIEAGQVLQPQSLAPGDRWQGTQRLG